MGYEDLKKEVYSFKKIFFRWFNQAHINIFRSQDARGCVYLSVGTRI